MRFMGNSIICKNRFLATHCLNTLPLTPEDFQNCFEHYFDAIRNYVYYRSGDQALASDIAQDVFLKLWQKQIPYEGERTKSLLYKMAGDAFVSHLRKMSSHARYTQSIHLQWHDADPQQALQHTELQKKYEETLSAMPEGQRQVFLMNRLDEMTYAEIADTLRLSVKAVEKRMFNALKQLKNALT